MKNIISVIIIIYSINICLSQNITVNDATWQQIKLDDFNSYNSTDWFNTYPWGNVNNGLEYNDPNNLDKLI